MRRLVICTELLVLCAQPLGGQTVPQRLARGDSLDRTMQPGAALIEYHAALAVGPADPDVLWRLARSEVAVAKQIVGDGRRERQARDSVYAVALGFAERAVAADSASDDAHFAVALVLGEQSRTKGGRERVRYGVIVYESAARALELDRDHEGALHILGAWHAEVKRLSRIERFFARTFLGGGLLGIAHWDSAAVHLERSVEVSPAHVYHRLELAQIYVDLERYDEARLHLETIPDLPDRNVQDPIRREQAARLLEEIGGRS